MKKLKLLIVLSVLIPTGVYCQTIIPNEQISSFDLRLTQVEQNIQTQQLALINQTETSQKEQLANSVVLIKTGLENGSQIEQILPSALQLLALKDLSETLNEINNPTSASVGTPFTEMVIESASIHLLPPIADAARKAQVKSKFRSILEAIYKGPMVQSFMNSNPISSIVNSAIQQAGFFEKDDDKEIVISKDQLSSIKKDNPLKKQINTANTDGASFDATAIESFNSSLEKRIEFYAALNNYTIEQNLKTQELYVDAKVIKRSIKASKTEICKLLNIDVNNASNGLDDKCRNLNNTQIKSLLADENFKKALQLSDFAKEQLPEVKAFKISVLLSITDYIDGYIKILEKHKSIAGAKLDVAKTNEQIAKLETIKKRLNNPVN